MHNYKIGTKSSDLTFVATAIDHHRGINDVFNMTYLQYKVPSWFVANSHSSYDGQNGNKKHNN